MRRRRIAIEPDGGRHTTGRRRVVGRTGRRQPLRGEPAAGAAGWTRDGTGRIPGERRRVGQPRRGTVTGRQRPRRTVRRTGQVAAVVAVTVVRVAGGAADGRQLTRRRSDHRRREELAEAGGRNGGWMGGGEQRGLVESDRRSVRSLHASSSAVVALLEHVLELDGRIERPVVALALSAALARHLDEAFVEAEVVADRVLPALAVALEVRELLHDVLVDGAQRQSLVLRVAHGHRDQRHVRVGRLLGGVQR